MELFRDYGVGVADSDDFEVKAFDATTVKEPGKTGGLWRIHYSVRLPSLACDFFKLTPTRGPGTGESFSHFPIAPGDFIVAERGDSTANGIGHVVCAGGYVTVRVNTGSLAFHTARGGHVAQARRRRAVVAGDGGVRRWGGVGSAVCVAKDPGSGPDGP